MSKKKPAPAAERPQPRLMLFTPPLDGGRELADMVAAAVAAADVAAVVIPVPRDPDERAVLKRLKPVIAAIQQGGAAALIEGAEDLVGKSGADGLHAQGAEGLADLVERFRPAKIVGAGLLRLKDDAMTAGEADADYVTFGEPGRDGSTPPFEAVLERVGWWQEVFELPCVGYAPGPEAVAPLAQAGADFVALGPYVFDLPEAAAEVVRNAAAQLALPAAEA